MLETILKIKNISGSTITICGMELNNNDEYILSDNDRIDYINDESAISAIENESVQVYINDNLLNIKTAIAQIGGIYPSSLAIDKNGYDQIVQGNDWTVITGVRIIWDLNEDYDTENFNFVIPFDGVYFLDGQFRISNIVNCEYIEIAVFKRGDPDDYWFILGKRTIDSFSETQMSAATSFNLYEDEEYTIKIKLYGDNASAKIIGEDDYTAWGLSFQHSLYGI